MSVITSASITGPHGKVEECAKITTGGSGEQFTFSDVAVAGLGYTLSFWVKSDATGNLNLLGETISTTTNWYRFVHTYTAVSNNITIDFGTTGTYYIYHLQLERGSKDTDWAPSPEDIIQKAIDADVKASAAQDAADEGKLLADEARALIKQIQDSISTLVRNGNDESLMLNTGNGWYFNMASTFGTLSEVSDSLEELVKEYGSTANLVEVLQGTVTDFGETLAYVNIVEVDNKPCIELGATNSQYKVLITNTEIRFMEGSHKAAYITNETLYITKAIIEEELRQGDFVWQARPNGNLGLIWKEAT